MANEAKNVRGAQLTLSTTIPALANLAISGVAGSYTETNTAGYPDAEFALAVQFASAPTENSTIDLVVRPKNIVGANHAEAPDATYRPHYVGSFVLNNVTTMQYLRCVGRDLPKEGDLYLYNNTTGVATNVNAALYMTPLTLGPA